MNSLTAIRPTAVRMASVLVAIALAGCGSGPAVQDPSASPATGATSSPTVVATSPVASESTGSAAAPGWRWQHVGDSFALGPDETVYTTGMGDSCEHELDALDAAGTELAGWPYCATPGMWPDFVTVDPRGTAYIAAGGETVVGLGIDGMPGASWPRGFGWLVGTRDDGIVLVTPSPTTLSEIVAYDATGQGGPGWPVKVPGAIADGASSAGSVAVGPDGSVAVLYRDLSTGYRWVTVIEPDGRTRPGWPVLVPNEMDGRSIALDLVTDDGRIVLRSHEPWPVIDSAAVMAGLQAQVAVISPDGTIPDGWPVRFDVPLSPLVEGTDGRLYAITGDVRYGAIAGEPPTGPYSVVALDRDGQTPAGWPVRLPDGLTPLVVSQAAGPVPPWAQPPVVGADGSMVVAVGDSGDSEGPHGIVWIGADGAIATTHLLPEGMTISNGQPSTPSGPPLAPVIAGDRAFLAVTVRATEARVDDVDRPVGIGASAGSLVNTEGGNDFGMDVMLAIDRRGAVEGWPLELPEPGFITRFAVTPGGLLVVSASGEPGYIAVADAWAGGD